MAYLILRYTLKDGVSRDDFEEWVRTFDYPNMRGLKRVKSFHTYRTTALLVGEGQPAFDYFELFEIDDFDGFCAEDMPGETVQAVMGAFMHWVDNPEFNIVERID